MRILAVESSCDDLSWAVVEHGTTLLSHKIASQVELHNLTGGVVPEVAAREHMRTVMPVLEELEKEIPLATIDAIACTNGPGLLGSLLVGITAAQTLALELGKPLIPVHHIEGHIYANWLDRTSEEMVFPMVVLTVSGGHNDLYFCEEEGSYHSLGSTLDDAAGEAFDKVARMLGLGYPGGPAIENFLKKHASAFTYEGLYTFPRSWGSKGSYTFSFSGLKSDVRRQVEAKGELTTKDVFEMAHAFQEAVVEVLGTKLLRAAKEKGSKTICVTGGVSANTALKDYVLEQAARYGISKDQVRFPMKKFYSTDNAAMIAAAAYFLAQRDPERVCATTEKILEMQPFLSYGLQPSA